VNVVPVRVSVGETSGGSVVWFLLGWVDVAVGWDFGCLGWVAEAVGVGLVCVVEDGLAFGAHGVGSAGVDVGWGVVAEA